jgi:Protein of unknown function (DUF4019)
MKRAAWTAGAILAWVVAAGRPLGAAPQPGPAAKPEAAAQASALAWLALVDEAKYDESWEEVAAYLRKALPKDKWRQDLGAAREPLGKLVSRKLKSAQYSEHLPGAPDGRYVVIQYDTVFEKKARAVETVTPMLDRDGAWRVTGYFIN